MLALDGDPRRHRLTIRRSAILRTVPAALIVLVAVVAIAVAVASYLTKQKRRESLATFGLRRGMEFSHADPYGIDHLPFRLFGRGDGRGCENVLSGTWEGLAVREADYWYYDENTDSKGNSSRTYHRFSLVVADIDAHLPHVCLEQENLFTRISDHLGFRDVEFESEDFNGRFQVRTADREFAFKLIDARMMAWLLSTGKSYGFEVNGGHALVWSDRLSPERLVPLFMVTKGFVEQVPRLVWGEYGTAGSESA